MTGWMAACERVGERAGERGSDGLPPGDPASLQGEVELVLPDVPPGREGESSRVTGALQDGAGRIVVVEADADRIRVHSAAGDFLYLVGESGGGAGEYRSPCCPAEGPDGRLWVRDRGNERYLAFTLRETDAAFEMAVPMAHEDGGYASSAAFDGEGRLVDVGREVDPATGREGVVGFHRAADGSVLRREALPVPPLDSLRAVRLDSELSTVLIHPPFGPRQLTAHAPGGGWAAAVSSRYLIDWRLADGRRVTIRGPEGHGPPVPAAERRAAEERLRSLLERLEIDPAEVALQVPERQPPLEDLLFDRAGRLWVSLLVPEGEPREAHVYTADGRRSATVRWPAGIALVREGLLEEHALGVVREEGRDRLVRLRFYPREGPGSRPPPY